MISIYTDGSSCGNPGPASVGIMIFDEKGEKLKEIREEIGNTTNNIAEYCAVILALISVSNKLETPITIYTDSELLVRQYEGKYKVKSENIIPFSIILRELASKFENINIKHINREDNVSHFAKKIKRGEEVASESKI